MQLRFGKVIPKHLSYLQRNHYLQQCKTLQPNLAKYAF